MATSSASRAKLFLRPNSIPTRNIGANDQQSGPSKRKKRLDSRLVKELIEERQSAIKSDNSDDEALESDYDTPVELGEDQYYDDPDDTIWKSQEVLPEREQRFDSWSSITSEMKLGDPLNETKFLVGANNLFDLLRRCCQSGCVGQGDLIQIKTHITGGVISVRLFCTVCLKSWNWQSIGTSAKESHAANSQFTGSILYTGTSPSRIVRYMKANSVAFPSLTTFFKNQREIHWQCVNNLWEAKRSVAVEECRAASPLDIGGDARCDSMGFSAQFGSYTLIDLKTGKILDMQPVSKVETAMNSVAMELEGLKRGLQKLRELQLEIKSIVTDRHSGIRAYMRQSEPQILHYYDCWHVVKSISKKLKEIGKRAKCKNEMTANRISSITNRLCRMAQTTTPGPNYAKEMDEKRLAILRHVLGIHIHPENAIYRTCTHGPVKNPRMHEDDPAYKALKSLLSKPDIRAAVTKLSPVGQTSRVESYHHVVLMFAPKNLCFGYQGMVSRLMLAALHYNENCDREVMVDERGNTLMRVTYCKWRAGKGTAHSVKEAATFDYLTELMALNYECTMEGRSLPPFPKAPLSMTSQLPTESREQVIQRHRRRFSVA